MMMMMMMRPLQDAMASAAGMEGVLVMLQEQGAASSGEDGVASAEVRCFLGSSRR